MPRSFQWTSQIKFVKSQIWIDRTLARTLLPGTLLYSLIRRNPNGSPVQAVVVQEVRGLNINKQRKFRLKVRCRTQQKEFLVLNEVTGHDWSTEEPTITESVSESLASAFNGQIIGEKYGRTYYHRDGDVFSVESDATSSASEQWETTTKLWNQIAISQKGLPRVEITVDELDYTSRTHNAKQSQYKYDYD